MGPKADEIQQVEAEIVALSAALNQRVEDVRMEADGERYSREQSGSRKPIRGASMPASRASRSCARWRIMKRPLRTIPPSTPPASDRRPAGAVILAALAERGTLPSGALDDLVVEAGWTKAAAVKAKQVLKRGSAGVRQGNSGRSPTPGARRFRRCLRKGKRRRWASAPLAPGCSSKAEPLFAQATGAGATSRHPLELRTLDVIQMENLSNVKGPLLASFPMAGPFDGQRLRPSGVKRIANPPVASASAIALRLAARGWRRPFSEGQRR